VIRTLIVVVGLALASPAVAQIVRVSVSTAGAEGNGPSAAQAISGDGRFVAFMSAATNLVAGDTNGLPDIFLRDRDTDADGVFDEPGAVATTRLNLGPGGVQANNASSDPAITPDGRFVCFVSKATNVVPGVPAEVLQVYRLDLTTGDTILVSANDAGTAGDLHSYDPAISADGNVVAFTSEASTTVRSLRPPAGRRSASRSSARCRTPSWWSRRPSIERWVASRGVPARTPSPLRCPGRDPAGHGIEPPNRGYDAPDPRPAVWPVGRHAARLAGHGSGRGRRPAARCGTPAATPWRRRCPERGRWFVPCEVPGPTSSSALPRSSGSTRAAVSGR
jgi:WD40-like Beta Propeller Repeat